MPPISPVTATPRAIGSAAAAVHPSGILRSPHSGERVAAFDGRARLLRPRQRASAHQDGGDATKRL